MSESATDVNGMREIYYSVEVEARLHLFKFYREMVSIALLMEYFLTDRTLS